MNIPKEPRFAEGLDGLMRWAQRLVAALTTRPSGQSFLAADYAITAATTWEDTGLSISLPESGTYRIEGDIRPDINTSAYIRAKLYNATDAADVANSTRMLNENSGAGIRFGGTVPLTMEITVDGPKTIKLYVYTTATGGIRSIRSDATGYTSLAWARLR